MSNNWFYSGAVNQINFNDEGQERGFFIHNFNPLSGCWDNVFYKIQGREHLTLHFTDKDITAIQMGNIDEVALNYWRFNGAVKDKIVRVYYKCSLENSKAVNTAIIEKTLLEDGAFMVWEILEDKTDGFVNRTELMSTANPETNLIKYLEEKQFEPQKVQELVLKLRPVIAKAEAGLTTGANTGVFKPVEIYVKNYRNYEEETFNFENVSFCTINGQNGAGKSSLFMDAIIDCLYEDPREGEKTGWIPIKRKYRHRFRKFMLAVICIILTIVFMLIILLYSGKMRENLLLQAILILSQSTILPDARQNCRSFGSGWRKGVSQFW